MVAYDLDGTLCTESAYTKIEKILFKVFGHRYGRFRKQFERPIYYPNGEYIIITARTVKNKIRTLRWLKKWGYTPKEVIFSTTQVNSAAEKIANIKAKNITIYVDNDIKILKTIASEIPNIIVRTTNEM